MKILKTLLLIVAIVTLISLFGCVKAGAREDILNKSSASETTTAAAQKESWQAPSGGQTLIAEMAQPDKNSGPYVIAHALNDTSSTWGADVWKGFENAAKAYPKLTLKQFDCKNNPDDSLKAVLNIQTLNPDMVIFFNWVGAGQEMAKWSTENKKPEMEIDVPYGENAWFYGVNNPMVGQLAGQKMGEWVKANWAGKDVTIVQNTEYESGEDVYLRNSEFLKVFQDTVGDAVKIVNINSEGKVDELNGDTSPEKGLELMSAWLTAHPDAKNIVVFSMTDEAGSGMYAAVKNANRLDQCVFGSINGTPNAFNIMVEDKQYLGTVAIFPELYGEGALKAAITILNKVEVPKKIIIKYDWVTMENIGNYYPQYVK
ncbi:MAG: sugar ABC transporter substrate-binding protein [Candidatus Humimicrobiaceae bacterium]